MKVILAVLLILLLGLATTSRIEAKKKKKNVAVCIGEHKGSGETCKFLSASTRECCMGGLVCTGAGVCVEPTSILFIGNSFTIRNNLPEMVRKLAVAGKNGPIIVDSSLVPASTLNYHDRTSQTTWSKIYGRGTWSFIVLQEQSQFLAMGNSWTQSKVLPYALDLAEGAVNVDAVTVLYQTWGYRYGDLGHYLNDDYYKMQSRIIDGYSAVQTALNAKLTFNENTVHAANTKPVRTAPVGEAWRELYKQNDATNAGFLYDLDGQHPSAKGSYLAACTLYATIFNKSPVGLDYFPKGVNAEIGRKIQQQAARTVGLL